MLRLRAHHVGCVILEIATRRGDHPTVPAAARRIAELPRGIVQVVVGPDDVCLPCPHWTGDACDRGFEEVNRAKDARFLALLGVREGATLAAGDLVDRFCARADLAFFREVCSGCRPEACAEAAAAVARSRRST